MEENGRTDEPPGNRIQITQFWAVDRLEHATSEHNNKLEYQRGMPSELSKC